MIDRKFKILAVNPINGKIYTEENALLLCAKDKAVPAALEAYRKECIRLGTNLQHIASVGLLLRRIERFQAENESRVPDTVGEEIRDVFKGKDFKMISIKIERTMIDFEMRTGKKPTSIYLGKTQWQELMEWTFKYKTSFDLDGEEVPEYDGCKVYRVQVGDHLAVA